MVRMGFADLRRSPRFRFYQAEESLQSWPTEVAEAVTVGSRPVSAHPGGSRPMSLEGGWTL